MNSKQQKNWIELIRNNQHPTPYKLTQKSVLRENVKTLVDLFPRIDFYYAVKSANDPEIIKTIDDLITGYDIASLGEFEQLKSLGIKSSRILYSNPVKIPHHIQKTFAEGVKYYAFDSVSEIQKLAGYAPQSNAYLRIKVSDYGSKFPLSKKFGAESIHVLPLMDVAREQGLNACGLTFHVGSQSESPHTWEAAFEVAGKAIAELEERGISVAFLNIGGGLPSGYVERIPTIRQLAKTINRAIKNHIPSNVRIVAEPGRFITANSSVIVSKVIGKVHRSGDDWLYLDMGVFQGLMEPLEISDWRYPIFTDRGNGNLPYSIPFTLTGPSCDAYDTIGLEYFLPPDIDVGDNIYIGSAGAYTTVYGSNFNGFEPPSRYYI